MIKRGALLHFDVEFTHPVPGVGEPMEFGFVAQEALFHDDGRIEVGDLRREMHQRWPVSRSAGVTNWVALNQSKLLDACYMLTRAGLRPSKSQRDLALWLREMRRELGGHIVPCGWTLGSDFAYLLAALGRDCDLVHYDALDITSLAFGALGRNFSDDGLREHFSIEKPVEIHHALVDARHQCEVFNALLALIAKRSDQTMPSG